MASWMVHLRIADLLLGMIDGLDACQFAIGNVAPDSGIADKNGRFHPPKEVSHYRDRTIPPSTFLNKDNLFYKDYLAAVSPSDKSRFSFLLGYFFHIVTDNLWVLQVWRLTKARFFAGEYPATELVQAVKENWKALDFLYLQKNPDALFCRSFLSCTYSQSFFDLLPLENIQHALVKIQGFYTANDTRFADAANCDQRYLTAAEMNTFVENTAVTLGDLYELLWGGKKRPLPPIKRSMLEILSENK